MTNIEWLRTLDVEQLSKWITEWAVKYQYKYTLSERALTNWLKEERYNSTNVKEESDD